MIFDPDALLRIVARQAATLEVPTPVSRATMRSLVAEAERLAGGRAEDEPAALFFAAARRARLFAKVASPFIDDLPAMQAEAVGLELDADELDLILLRGRIAYDAAGWADVRAAFARWLRRPGERPKRAPAKRPR